MSLYIFTLYFKEFSGTEEFGDYIIMKTVCEMSYVISDNVVGKMSCWYHDLALGNKVLPLQDEILDSKF